MLRSVSLLMALADAAASTTPEQAGGTGGSGFPWGSVVGGVVGALLTVLVRALDVGAEIRRNDAAVAEQDQALADWAADRGIRLRLESAEWHTLGGAGSRAMAAQAPGAVSGSPEDAFARSTHLMAVTQGKSNAEEADARIAALRAEALREYRDRERQTRLEVAKVLAPEQWHHRVYRRLKSSPAPTLHTPQAVAPLLASWRKPATYSVALTVPDDATTRTLADVIKTEPVTGP